MAVAVKKTAFWNVETCCMVDAYHTARRHIVETRCLGETAYLIYVLHLHVPLHRFVVD